MAENTEGDLEFPQLNWSVGDKKEDELPIITSEDDILSWSPIDQNKVSSLEQPVLTKRERAFNLDDCKAPFTILRARAISRKADPGDELSFFYNDVMSIEDFRFFAKEDRLNVLFDGVATDGEGFVFAFSVPEKAKRTDFY